MLATARPSCICFLRVLTSSYVLSLQLDLYILNLAFYATILINLLSYLFIYLFTKSYKNNLHFVRQTESKPMEEIWYVICPETLSP